MLGSSIMIAKSNIFDTLKASTIYGNSSTYLRIGDASTTAHSLASEDDLMVTGRFEVTGNAFFDSECWARNASNYFVYHMSCTTGQYSVVSFEEDSIFHWQIGYTGGGDFFYIRTADSDGIGTDDDVIRIPDGQLTVDFNATADENAFDDYDDAMVLRDAFSGGLKEKLLEIGVYRKYEDGWIGYSPHRMDALLAGGIYQTRQALDNTIEYIQSLEKRVETLENKGV